ncbi:rhodanese-like domain-containing protein [Flammeovirga aprica]|uniref:Rhodanese-like domain-containing protein n=1 Tax=Flammeovirga aprica JL-4 TaxID=694437 RepID=A0A7X9P122_9BACT|nr:rhodanese-like domain-containing protein [Flammeovirga aprica]NME67480.1 rhodanese-like domain-containing protein [Flammeovirga aprica JL-4]
MKNFFISLLIGIVFFSACNRAVNNEPQVAVSDFVEIRQENPNAIVLDVRTPGEFNGGTMEGAVNINVMDDSFTEEVEKLDKDATVMVFCKSGGRSAKAKQKLVDLGFTKVVDLEGGITDWKKAGGKVIIPQQ